MEKHTIEEIEMTLALPRGAPIALTPTGRDHE
jgi:hypothetical protein